MNAVPLVYVPDSAHFGQSILANISVSAGLLVSRVPLPASVGAMVGKTPTIALSYPVCQSERWCQWLSTRQIMIVNC